MYLPRCRPARAWPRRMRKKEKKIKEGGNRNGLYCTHAESCFVPSLLPILISSFCVGYKSSATINGHRLDNKLEKRTFGN